MLIVLLGGLVRRRFCGWFLGGDLVFLGVGFVLCWGGVVSGACVWAWLSGCVRIL